MTEAKASAPTAPDEQAVIWKDVTVKMGEKTLRSIKEIELGDLSDLSQLSPEHLHSALGLAVGAKAGQAFTILSVKGKPLLCMLSLLNKQQHHPLTFLLSADGSDLNSAGHPNSSSASSSAPSASKSPPQMPPGTLLARMRWSLDWLAACLRFCPLETRSAVEILRQAPTQKKMGSVYDVWKQKLPLEPHDQVPN